MWKSAAALPMIPEQKRTLETWVRARATPRKIVLRSRICLLAHAGQPNLQIARQLKTSRPTVLLWRERFHQAGPAGLAEDASHGVSPQRLDKAQVKAVVEATLHTTPPDATHWTTRTMARRMGLSHMTVARIWDAHGLQPHRESPHTEIRD